jgi:hypothetical protein
MAIPKEKSIRLVLLRVITDAGGELSVHDAVKAVEAYFPELTEEDRKVKLPSGSANLFVNRVQWARQGLVLDDCLYREPRGIWRITPKGKNHLLNNWPNWKPHYSHDRQIYRKQSDNILNDEKDHIEPVPNQLSLSRHEYLQQLLSQIGDILGYYTEVEFRESPYIYDVIWKTFPQAQRPSIVFEVQDKGNLIEALAKLQHAKDIWGSRLFLAITGDHDQKRIEKFVAPLLAGTFHRLARDLTILTPEKIEKIYEPLNSNRDLIRKLIID